MPDFFFYANQQLARTFFSLIAFRE